MDLKTQKMEFIELFYSYVKFVLSESPENILSARKRVLKTFFFAFFVYCYFATLLINFRISTVNHHIQKGIFILFSSTFL